jgi:uncharacterized SAM-binding protein YcdF (DUF218 family)
MRIPTESEIAEINSTHFADTPLEPADLLFVFGTSEDAALRANTAHRLWRDGLFRRAIVSGGVMPGSPLSECEVIKAAMVARGIPPERILEEDRSTNTGENVVFSCPYSTLRSALPTSAASSASAIHGRRGVIP